ncbi:MAG: hypothetical protein KC561_12915, partial [Myxococcales bacterium]|nr:hypothetical protein [Myxococcales bacterium]
TVAMDFTRSSGFYSAPFPDESRRLSGPDGDRIDVSDFPNPRHTVIVRQLLEIAEEDIDGFGATSTIYLPLTEVSELQLPTLEGSVAEDSDLFLMTVEGPHSGTRFPFDATLVADAGPFGSINLLALVPLQGVPMYPETLHAAVLMRSAGGDGELGRSESMARLAAGIRPEGMSEEAFSDYRAALEMLENTEGVAPEDIAGLAVFRTHDPTAGMRAAREQVLSGLAPELNGSPTLSEVYDSYCVFSSTIDMPAFQFGEPPFAVEDGYWTYDTAGNLIQTGSEEARVFITLPRAAMPAEGFPIVVFIRTGGGGDRPLIDRGLRSEPGGSTVPGSGPATQFAAVGFAGITVDGPHGGTRNITDGDEQFLMFNVQNPRALRDNVRQSALEISLLANLLEDIEIAPGECPDLDLGEELTVHFDTEHVALFGHSMGATIAPLVLATEPTFGASLLSGAGGSWIENILYKRKPLNVRPIAEALVGYTGTGRILEAFDPVLMLLQWTGEPADPPVYGQLLNETRSPAERPHVLMMQGIVDSYILPPIANTTSLSFGLDLGGDPLDQDHEGLQEFRSLIALMPLVGSQNVELPATANVGDAQTAIVTQNLQGPIEDGHEVVFQTEGPKTQYSCFLDSWLDGTPVVPGPSGCP